VKQTLLFLLIFVVLAVPALAQETFRVGDIVETADGRQCRIESIAGGSAKVRCGPNRSDLRVYSFRSLTTAKAPTSTSEQQPQTQAAVSSQVVPPTAGQSGQPAFRVGDAVVSPGGRPGTIESINGNSAKIRIGPGKYDFTNDLLENLKSPKAAALAADQEQMRKSFRVEANKYYGTVRLFDQFYNPEFAEVKGGIDAAVIKRATVELSELDALCTSKYPGITNDPNYLDRLTFRSGDWCGIAAKRNELLQSVTSGTHSAVASRFIEGWKRSIDKSYHRRGVTGGDPVWDDVQAMLFDREKWKARDLPNLQRLYAQNGGTVPVDIFDAVKPDLDKLRQKVETDAKANTWMVPPYQDAAIEALVKRSYAANPKFKGIVIVKSGMDFTTWKLFKNDLGIPTSQIKKGRILVKIANQQGLCQAREFAVEKLYTGGGGFSAVQMAGFSEAGTYMQCN
jgi:hypothetical protein